MLWTKNIFCVIPILWNFLCLCYRLEVSLREYAFYSFGTGYYTCRYTCNSAEIKHACVYMSIDISKLFLCGLTYLCVYSICEEWRKSWVCVLLAWPWPCQGPQCLRPMEITTPSSEQPQELAKPSSSLSVSVYKRLTSVWKGYQLSSFLRMTTAWDCSPTSTSQPLLSCTK